MPFTTLTRRLRSTFLVIPKEHIQSVSADHSGEFEAWSAHPFERHLQAHTGTWHHQLPCGFQLGEQAGQSVLHLHFHVLAGPDMTWPPG